MSKPTNSAARNQMTEWERQCYDWGWEDAEERIIKVLEDSVGENVDHCEWGTHLFLDNAIELIKGEQK